MKIYEMENTAKFRHGEESSLISGPQNLGLEDNLISSPKCNENVTILKIKT